MLKERKKIIIVGGGFAGIACAKSFKKTPNVDILLIDKSNHHVFQPLLYQVATSSLSPADIAYPLRTTFSQQKNVRVIMGNVVTVDNKKQILTLRDGITYSFDYLIMAVGARHSYFGKQGWDKYALGLKTIKDALNIREKMLYSFELAERTDDEAERKKFMTFVIVGGGPTGVEMAGAIAEIAKQTMIREFREICSTDAKIILVEYAPRLLPVYPESLSEKAKFDLQEMGVEVRLNTQVTDIQKDLIYLGDETLATTNVIWAAGNEAAPVIRLVTENIERNGQALVNSDYSITENKNIFCIGDCAKLTDANGTFVPGVAPAAAQAGRYVSQLIKNELKDKPRKPFIYLDKGSMATIGKARAVAVVGPLKFHGLFAWLMWSVVHVWYLIDFRSKFIVILSWIGHFLSQRRAVRLITNPKNEDPLK